jgi:hypothetical protein
MKLVITIDTEEDQWGGYLPSGQTVENIKQIPVLQALFDEFHAIPTYLLTYPVATHPGSVALLRAIQDDGRCEIGTHCHPWNTPPFEGETGTKETMLCNLPEDLIYRKLECLHNTLTQNLGTAPTSFRAGRWGYGGTVAHALSKLGYRVDSSIYALTDWTRDHGPNFSDLHAGSYYFHPGTPFTPDTTGPILEVPATVGFLQKNEPLAAKTYVLLQRSHLLGVLDGLHLLNKVALSPELTDGPEMITLVKQAIERKLPIANLFFHSSSLRPGATPFIRSASDLSDFLNRIRRLLQFTREAGIESIRLSDATSVVPRCA